MNNLPIELIHMIANQLNYFDQINLKSISQWFYENGLFNRHLPGTVIIRKPIGHEYDQCIKNNIRYSSVTHATPLRCLRNTINEKSKEWRSFWQPSFDIYIQRRTNVIPGSGGTLYVRNCDCKPDFELKVFKGRIYFNGKPLNYKLCIQKCADVVRHDMFDCDLITY